ncbi:MAG: hypothetical protein H6850_01875 [Alphaproteobacteria bacterium]|nr:MAG: hypothetical protein H6850_01875 [Alphaproteobacteria bacterium]
MLFKFLRLIQETEEIMSPEEKKIVKEKLENSLRSVDVKEKVAAIEALILHFFEEEGVLSKLEHTLKQLNSTQYDACKVKYGFALAEHGFFSKGIKYFDALPAIVKEKFRSVDFYLSEAYKNRKSKNRKHIAEMRYKLLKNTIAQDESKKCVSVIPAKVLKCWAAFEMYKLLQENPFLEEDPIAYLMGIDKEIAEPRFAKLFSIINFQKALVYLNKTDGLVDENIAKAREYLERSIALKPSNDAKFLLHFLMFVNSKSTDSEEDLAEEELKSSMQKLDEGLERIEAVEGTEDQQEPEDTSDKDASDSEEEIAEDVAADHTQEKEQAMKIAALKETIQDLKLRRTCKKRELDRVIREALKLLGGKLDKSTGSSHWSLALGDGVITYVERHGRALEKTSHRDELEKIQALFDLGDES